MAAHVPSRLYRSRSQKMLAGVCGGLGEYFDVDPVLIRLLFVVTAFISGVGILAYIVLWIVVPFEGGDTSRIDTLKRDFEDMTGRVRDFVDPPRTGTPPPAPWQAGPSGPTGPGGPGRPAEPDVTGYHGSYGPATPGPSASDPRSASFSGGSPAAASPFDTGRDATMTSDSTSARVPGTDDPTANPSSGPAVTADRPAPADAPGSAAAATSPGSVGVDDSPLEIDPPPGTPPFGTPPFGTPPFGAPAGSATGNYAGAAPGTPPFGAPYGPPPGSPPFGSPFGGPAGGPASGSYGAPAGSQPWSAPRDSGPAFTASAPTPSERKRRRQHWAGAILILIGLMILGNNLGLLFWVRMQYVMPLILVGLGAWLMFGRGRRG